MCVCVHVQILKKTQSQLLAQCKTTRGHESNIYREVLQFQPEIQQFFNCRHFDYIHALKKDYNTVVETLAIKELLLNFGLELKKLRDEFY